MPPKDNQTPQPPTPTPTPGTDPSVSPATPPTPPATPAQPGAMASSDPTLAGKPKKKLMMIILIALAALLVIGGAVAAYFLVFNKYDPEKESNKFFSHLVDKEYDQAYEFFHEDLKAIYSQDKLKAEIDSLNLNNSCTLSLSSESVVETELGDADRVLGKINCDTGSAEAGFLYLQEGGEMIGYSIRPEGATEEE